MNMTRLGEFLDARSINKAEVARKIGTSNQRLNELTKNPGAHLRASEVYLIAKAIGTDPCELLDYVCQDLK
ncbi:helix-turn-helix domain-containing protein [Algoriphagus halophilus]|uniref:Putative transcriptional regulator n=1 Tax=Algoriphagus halophilus TaxID=226505 RepID=A0A1N6E6J5_9BACT|nr:helix-turn-helix transcriptional regulator [Algoriphagus halophilus]SIN78650.1 putative transcriptional regulator [Algoriphagus halophilus]